MDEKYLLSIVVPVYNAERYIARISAQLLDMLDDRMELIFVDDGSTDNSLYLLKETWSDIGQASIIHQKNGGAPRARNHGLKHARGEYVWFFDVDDVFEKKAIQEVISKIEEQRCDIYIGNMRFIPLNSRPRLILPLFNSEISDDVRKLFLWDTNPGNKIYKRSIIEENNVYWSNVKVQQDMNFYLKYIVHCTSVCYLRKILYTYQQRENSIATSCNCKVLEVVKSVGMVASYYKTINVLSIYEKELEYNLVKHIFYDLENLKKMTLYDKIHSYFYFRSVLSKINYMNNILICNEYKERLIEFMKLSYIASNLM